jgi:hypothetical protein
VPTKDRSASRPPRLLSAGLAVLSAAFGIALPTLLSDSTPAHPTGAFALDVRLEFDAAMVGRAKAINTRLRSNYPEGYPLDVSQMPHISLAQGVVRDRDADVVVAAVRAAIQSAPPLPMRLIATSFTASERSGIGVLAYRIEPSPELRQLTERVTEAVQRFATGIAETGMPRVTVGVAHPSFVRELQAEPFEKFRFIGVNVAAYFFCQTDTERTLPLSSLVRKVSMLPLTSQ